MTNQEQQMISSIIEELENNSDISLYQACNNKDIDEMSLTDEQLEYLDDCIFQCGVCGKWNPISNASDMSNDDGIICDGCND